MRATSAFVPRSLGTLGILAAFVRLRRVIDPASGTCHSMLFVFPAVSLIDAQEHEQQAVSLFRACPRILFAHLPPHSAPCAACLTMHLPGDSVERLTTAARFHDYRRASNPLAAAGVAPIPGARFGAELHEQGPTRILPLDTSATLGCPGPATTPGLCANFVRIQAGDAVVTDANATSHLFFVMRGAGSTRLAGDGGGDAAPGTEIPWRAGDLFTLPARSVATHAAVADAALYWVHDEPLLRHLGAVATARRFGPTLYRHEAIRAALDAVVRDPESARANRVSVLLGNHLFPQSMTVTHVLWAMFGILPAGAVQSPHRHQSVAVDLVVDAQPGCYTMVGRKLAADGSIADGERFPWQPHSVFVTPPGLWHSHHNDSGAAAHILPIQDAGLHTYLRTLSILFSRRSATGHDVVEDAG